MQISTADLLAAKPVSAHDIAVMIAQLGDRISDGVTVLDELLRARYDAEEAYSTALEKSRLSAPHVMLTDRRSAAKVETADLLHEVNQAKALLHHAENLQRAMEAKLSGYQTIAKLHIAAYGAAG